MPSITGLSRTSFGDGAQVTMSGTGFGTTVGTLTIGGVNQSIASWTDTQIVFNAVRGTQGMGPARVDVVTGTGAVLIAEAATLFIDGFESGDFSTTQNSVRWTGSDSDVTVQAGRGVGGGNSAQFAFVGSAPGADASAERRFDLGALYTELTIAFDLYIPNGAEAWGGAAYAHRADSPNNNKFFRIWPVDYNDDTKVGASLFTTTDAGVISKTRSEWAQAQFTSVGENGVARVPFINAADRGTWIAVEIYCKAATATSDGTMQIYKNGTLVIDNTSAVNNYRAGLPEGWRYGYLLGYANSGFDATTYLQIDNVRFRSGPRVWGFQGLETGLTGLNIDQGSGPVTWEAGGFARVTYNQSGTNGISLPYTSMPAGTKNVHVQFDTRRYSLGVSKTLKVHSKGRYFAEGGYNDASNITVWGSSYSGADVSLSYGDGSSGGDTQSVYQFTGAHVGQDRSLPTVRTASSAIPELVYDGSTWHTLRIWIKFNDDNVQNGEFAAWIDGVLKLHLTEMWNCATTISDGVNAAVAADQLWQYQERGAISLGDYSQAPATYPFYEDYRNFKIGYTRPLDLPGY